MLRSPSHSPPRSPTSAKFIADSTVALQLQQFLDDWHYRIIHSTLGRRWPRQKVIIAALDILILNGAAMSEEEKNAFAQLDEQVMLEKVAARLPQDLRERFEYLALQLQMVVTMMTRARKFLEDGDDYGVTALMEENDCTGLGQQVLKRTVVSASTEISEIQLCQTTWISNMEGRLERMLKAAETAEHANRQLLVVEAQLDEFGSKMKTQGKRALIRLAEGSSKAIMQTTFSGWLGTHIREKAENAIRSKIEAEIAGYEEELVNAKKKRFGNISGVLAQTAKEGDAGIMSWAFATWKSELVQRKKEGDTAAAVKDLEEKLKAAKGSQSDNSKKVLARMAGDRIDTLKSMMFQTWVSFSEEYKKDKEFEDQVKKTEAQLREFQAKQKDHANSVLSRMSAANDSGLLSLVIKEWADVCVEGRKLAHMDKMMGGADGQFKAMQMRQVGNARGVQTRVNEQMKMNMMMQCWGNWLTETKINAIHKYYSTKIEGKRRQLSSVQTLFKSFAVQLEEGLGSIEGDSSGRTYSTRVDYASRRKISGAGSMKESMSLPDIHHRPAVA